MTMVQSNSRGAQSDLLFQLCWCHSLNICSLYQSPSLLLSCHVSFCWSSFSSCCHIFLFSAFIFLPTCLCISTLLSSHCLTCMNSLSSSYQLAGALLSVSLCLSISILLPLLSLSWFISSFSHSSVQCLSSCPSIHVCPLLCICMIFRSVR